MAKFARVSRDTLLYYDKIGLFSPVMRGENGYRYYSEKQIANVNLIHTFQSLGMSLERIKEFAQHRTPEQVLDVLNEQIRVIDRDIHELESSRRLLATIQDAISHALKVDETRIELEWREAERILLGPENDYSGDRTLQDALFDFYFHCTEVDSKVDLNYSAWGLFTFESMQNHDWDLPDRFYFNNPKGPDTKPAAWYVTGYHRGDYGQGQELYERLIAFIEENGLEISGPAYEMYPLNELSVINPENYLLQVSITVAEPPAFFSS
jgi:DNA-binding transcriptional MerR regulator